MTRPQSFGRILRSALFGALAFMSVSIVAGGCLDRPVAPATPSVSARIVTPAKQNKVSKIDLLFMIDNSSSMADKQSILAQAVPDLVNRLVNPICINPMTGMQTGNRNANGSCTVGEPDFDPVNDIHIGLISSSLGSHGAAGVCDDVADMQRARAFPHNDDKAHLVARTIAGNMETTVPTFNNLGFLNWNPNTMNGQTAASIAMPFASMVTGVGQHGCGYEASLEAVYRFLIEPDPYMTLEVTGASATSPGNATLTGVDMALLQQRADFLRPDSLVAVMMITDENDCSVIDGGQNFYPLVTASVLGHGTTPCLTNPNDQCCHNCGQKPPPGCPAIDGDPECQAGALTLDRDPPNLRCWDQKRRYGVDFLYPVERYIAGFRNSKIGDRAGTPGGVKNPLYDDLTPACKMMNMGCAGERDKSLVFVAGLVGVPWQDIAVNSNDLTQGYLTAQQITDQNVWAKILGVPRSMDPATPYAAPVLPTDPHMIESVVPRPGLAPPTAAANADPIHGHEWNIAMASPSPNADLQYACVFPLNPTKTCTETADCDCFSTNPAAAQNPLCQGANGMYSNTQSRAKGYPGTRHLQVLQGLGEQAIVASICPSNVANMAAVDYGYRPAIAALISRLRNALRGRCLPRTLAVDDQTKLVPCVIVEAFNPPVGETCPAACSRPGRLPIDPNDTVLTPEVKLNSTCWCEIQQLVDPDKTICETQVAPGGMVASGWCYVDPSQAAAANVQAECQIVRSCPATNRRIIRFVNPDSEPRAGATAFIMCQEKSFPSSGGVGRDPCTGP